MDVPTPGVDDPANNIVIPADDLCLPSPATDSLSGFSQYGIHTVSPLPQPPPRPSQVSDIPTPYSELVPDLTFAPVGAVMLQSNLPPKRPILTKAAALNFKLPLFEKLEITLPHPDYLLHSSGPYTTNGPEVTPVLPDEGFAGGQYLVQPLPMHTIIDPSPSLSPDEPGGMSSPSTLHQFVITRTPLADGERIPVEDGASEVENSAPLQGVSVDESAAPVVTSSTGVEPQIPSESQWMLDVIPRIVSAMDARLVNSQSSQIRILTHALPMPSYQGHCFPIILTEVHSLLLPRRTTWISHWHAVSGRFNLAELPTTPPSTPGAPGVGDDYFTTRVFDSAVAVPDYQQHAAFQFPQKGHAALLRAAPTTQPRPAVPPSSVHISITERYIPPTSSSEFVDLFDPMSGRSLLSDRLTELADDCGLLIFIYPTKLGAQTFLKHYLGTTLDPILRRMMVVNELTTNVCQEIGTMQAVEELRAFEELDARLRAFCEEMSSPSSQSSTILSSLLGKPMKYSVVESSRKLVNLSPEVWADWWCGQEKPRIRKILDSFLRLNPGRGRSSSGVDNIPISSRARLRDVSSSDGSTMSYMIEIIQGLKKGAMGKSHIHKDPIEVGLFVIRKELAKESSGEQPDNADGIVSS